MSQESFLQWLTGLQVSALNSAAKLITFMGSEEFYLIAIPFVYWCVAKRLGFRLFYVFALSMYVNTVLKAMIAAPRPIGAEGVSSLYADPEGYGYPNDSFPSGHMQGTATFWGYLALQAGRPALWIAAAVMLLLVGASRLYLGLHWPLDIVGGLGVAVVLIALSTLLERALSRSTDTLRALAVVMLPIILFVAYPLEGTAKVTGVMLGAGLGYLWETSRLRVHLPDGWGRRAVAFVIGIAGVLAIKSGLQAVLSEGHLFEAIRYACIGFWVIGAAPWLFVQLRLTRRDARY